MASATVGATSKPNHLTLESIPTVDLRLLTQSELTALSLLSANTFNLRNCDDVVIPKIDRSVFNESAGSRKQTYSRLRLAPRSNPNFNPPKPRSLTPEPPVLDSDRAENNRIVSVFKKLFNLGDAVDVSSLDEQSGDLALVPVSVSYCDTVPGPVNHDAAIVVVDGNRKRKRAPFLSSASKEVEKVEVEEEEKGANWEEKERELVNKSGVVVNLAELAKMEDPYRHEISRQTAGRETADELLGFVTEVEGQWGSTRKKRKIVDANLFGDFLPNGWKVLIAIKKKQGRAWVFCRRYVSPNGRHFVSCKEVSSYLLSLTGPQQLKEQPTVQVRAIIMGDDLALKNAEDIETKVEYPAVPDSTQSIGHVNRQMVLHISPTQENQVTSSKDSYLGVVNSSTSALNCHKCSAAFCEKNELLNHLISCHKRKRRKSGAPVEDDVLLKDGKYECQFCKKFFFERSSYFGHIGIHVKNYARSIGGTLGGTANEKTCEPITLGEVPMTMSHTPGSAKLYTESVAGTPNDEKLLENENNHQNISSHQIELTVEAAQTNKSLAGEFSGRLDDVVDTHNNTMEVNVNTDFSNVKHDNYFGSDEGLFDDSNDVCEKSLENAPEWAPSEVSKSPAVIMENSEAGLFSETKQLDLVNDDNFVAVNLMESEGILSSEFDLPVDDDGNSGHQISGYGSLVNKPSGRNFFDEQVEVGDDEGMADGSVNEHIDIVMDGDDDIKGLGNFEEYSAVPHREEESCDVTVSKIEHVGSKVSNCMFERGPESSLSTQSADQQTETAMQNKRLDFTGLVNETDVDLCDLENMDVTIDTKRDSPGKFSGSAVLGFPKNYGPNNIGNKEVSGCDYDVGVMQPPGGRSFQVDQTCDLENTKAKVLNRKGEVQSSDLFFTAGRSDTHLDANYVSYNDQSHNEVSNAHGDFSNFIEDKQARVPKSLLSCLSMSEHSREVAMNGMGNVSSTTCAMHFSGLDKVDSSSSNKSILDFSNMTELNGRFPSSVHDNVPETSSPFQLWGQQSCGLEDNQNKIYGDASGVAQLERDSHNNSLHLIGFQQPSSRENSYNEVCMNEQRYAQHNKAEVFSRSNDSRRQGITHGSTLNLAGFSQQCGSGYNLNNPGNNQQGYSVQHTESGAYRSCDQAREERVAYGNSLSLASVQQTVDAGYSLNKGYVDSIQGLSKLDNHGNCRDRDLMIGFGNSSSRSNQTASTEFLWRPTEGSNLPGGSSSSRGQSSGSFQAFDFLSDKGGNDLYTANEKFDNMSNFEDLRSSVEPTEFSFMTTQESNSKKLQYNTEMDQSFGSLPNMMSGHVTTLCVWCGNEFHQDPLVCEMQAGSIGYLCPNCKARMSGQFL